MEGFAAGFVATANVPSAFRVLWDASVCCGGLVGWFESIAAPSAVMQSTWVVVQ